jgi:hypothetical protein
MNTSRRVSYIFLCIIPFLNFVVVGARAFRVPGVYQVVGAVYFIAIAVAAWILSGQKRGLTKRCSEPRCALMLELKSIRMSFVTRAVADLVSR